MNKRNKDRYIPEMVCEAHAAPLGIKATCKHRGEQEPDEFIECEVCQEVVMRNVGVL